MIVCLGIMILTRGQNVCTRARVWTQDFICASEPVYVRHVVDHMRRSHSAIIDVGIAPLFGMR